MPVIKANSLRDLKNRVNIHDVVVRVVALKKAGGGRFKGLCPFHSEKTPSFNVSADKGFYKCFGCGKAGDVINFVMETEGLQFTEAVEAIAQRSGITLEYEEGSGGPSKETRSLKQEIFDIHDLAAEFYRQAFLASTPHGTFIRDYWIKNRKFTLDLAEEFKIGFAPVDDSALAGALLKRKFSEDALRQCGLFFTRDGAVLTLGAMRPRFRGRLMIPIRDHQGRVVAFTARQLELTPADDPAREAKYVNSPETPIFIKSNLLFNLDRARQHVGKPSPYDQDVDIPGMPAEKASWPFVLVEGQLDALRCWSVGLKTAIAPQGTSITESQLALLRRYHPQVECFFDSDSAGQKAALRFLPMALKAGLEVRFLMLAGAEKLDPDLLFLEQGLGAYTAVRKSSLKAMEFLCRALVPNPSKITAEEKARAAAELFEVIKNSDSAVVRWNFMEQAAPYLRMSPVALEQDFKSYLAKQSKLTPIAQRGQPISIKQEILDHSAEYDLLLYSLHNEEALVKLPSLIPLDWIDESHLSGRLLGRFLVEISHNGWPGNAHINDLLHGDDEKALITSLLFEAPREDDPLKVINEALKALKRRFYEPRQRQIELEIASKGTDVESDLLSLLKQRAEITRQLLNPPKLSLGS